MTGRAAPPADAYAPINAALARGEIDQAERALGTLLARSPDDARAHFLAGRAAGLRGDAAAALAAHERAVAIDPADAEYRAELGRCLLKAGRIGAALEAAAAVAACATANDLALNAAAMIHTALNRHDLALPLLARAIGSGNPAILFNLSVAQKYCGQLAAAERTVRRIVAMAPDNVKARAALSGLRHATAADNQIAEYQALLSRLRDPAARLHVCHAAAAECDQLGRHDDAFALLAQGKAGMLPAGAADFGPDRALFEALHHGFDQAPAAAGLHGPQPIFVVGMPRSGTTVVERIVSAHPSVGTVGESLEFGRILQQRSAMRSSQLIAADAVAPLLADPDFGAVGRAYLDRLPPLSGDRTRPLDKFHLNVLLAGFIVRALPDARILCVIRDPLDTIWGNYRRIFEYRSAVYRYAFALETLARFYVAFRQLADAWSRMFPDNFRIVRYEALVADPSGQGRAMLDFCGLDWSADFLRIEDNPAPVTSASAVQVRRGLNATSIGRWRHYERHLAPATRILTAAGIDWK